MSTLATLTVKLVGDISAFTKSMGDAQDKLHNVGVGMMKAGGIATAGLTLPLAGVGAAAITAGQQLNEGMANVASLGVATDRVNDLKVSVQDMAVQTGKSTSDLTGGLYQVISAFGDTADTADILRINAMAAAGGMASTTEAINLTSAVTKGYGDTSKTAVQHAADLALKTVEMGQTTFPELAGAIGRVVPIAAALGVSQEELFATMATGAGVTGTTSEVATQLRGVMQSLMAPTGDMTKLMESLGYTSGEAMIKELGLQGAVEAVVGAANESGQPLQSYIGSIEGQTLALSLAGEQNMVMRQKMAEMQDASGKTSQAFAAQTEGINKTGFEMEQTRIKMEVMMQKIYDGLVPALQMALDKVEPFVDWLVKMAGKFGELDPKVQTIIVGVALFAAALGPLLVVLGMAVTALGALLSPIGLVVLAVAAVIAIVAAMAAAWHNDWGGIRTKTQEYMGEIGSRVSEGMDKVKAFINSGLDLIRGWWDDHGESVRTIVNVFWGAIKGKIDGYINDIKTIIDTVLGVIRGIWEAHGETIKTVARNTWELIKTIIKGWLDIIGDIVDAFAALLTGDWDRLAEELKSIWRTLWSMVEAVFKTAKANVIVIATDIKNTVTAKFEELKALALGKINDLKANLIAKFNDMRSTAKGIVDGLKGDVLGILGGLASEAFGRGAALVQRLAAGIRSAIGAVVDAASALAAAIRRFLPGSDAEVGPLSDLYASGRALPQTLAAGIVANSAAPAQAAEGMTQGITDVLDLLKQNVVEVVAALADLARTFAGGTEGSDLASAKAGLDAYVPVVEAFGKVLDVVVQAMSVELVADAEERLAALTGMVARVIPGFVAAMALAAGQFTTAGWVDSVKAFSEGALAAVAPVRDGIDALIAINEGVDKLDGDWIDARMGAFTRILGGLVEYMRRVGAYFTQEGWVESVEAFSKGAVAATAPVENGVKALIAINEGVGKLDGNWIDARMEAFTAILGGLVEYMRRTGAYFTQEGWVESVKDFSAGAIAATAPVENGVKALIAINEGITKLNGYNVDLNMQMFSQILGGFVEYMRQVAVQFTTTGLDNVRAFATAAEAASKALVEASEVIVEKAVPASADFATASAAIGLNIMAGMASLTEPWGFAPGIVAVMQAIQQAVLDANINIQGAWGGLSTAAYQFGALWIGNLIAGVNSRKAELYRILDEINGRFGGNTPWTETGGGGGHGGMAGAGGNTYNVTIYNPADRPSDADILRTMRNLAVVGAI